MASNKEKNMTMEALVESTTENTNEETTAAAVETTTTIAVAEAAEATEEIKEIPGTAVTTANRGKGLGYYEKPVDVNGINNFESLLKQASDRRTQAAAEEFMHKVAPELTSVKGTERLLEYGYVPIDRTFIEDCLESVLRINRLSTKGEIAKKLDELTFYIMRVQHLKMIPSMREIFLDKAVDELTAAGISKEDAEQAKESMLEKAKVDRKDAGKEILPYNSEQPEGEVWIVLAEDAWDSGSSTLPTEHAENIAKFRDMVKEAEAKEAAEAANNNDGDQNG